MATKTELAWAAGLFEGEGSIFIQRQGNGRWNYFCMAVGMTDEDTVRRFAQVIGHGTVVKKAKPKPPGKLPMYVWRISGTRAEQTYTRLQPWLGPRRQAKAAKVLAECHKAT